MWLVLAATIFSDEDTMFGVFHGVVKVTATNSKCKQKEVFADMFFFTFKGKEKLTAYIAMFFAWLVVLVEICSRPFLLNI